MEVTSTEVVEYEELPAGLALALRWPHVSLWVSADQQVDQIQPRLNHAAMRYESLARTRR